MPLAGVVSLSTKPQAKLELKKREDSYKKPLDHFDHPHPLPITYILNSPDFGIEKIVTKHRYITINCG